VRGGANEGHLPSELMVEALGSQALAFAPAGPDPGELPVPAHAQGVTSLYLNLRKVSIYGGSNEIQKNIISQMILGL